MTVVATVVCVKSGFPNVRMTNVWLVGVNAFGYIAPVIAIGEPTVIEDSAKFKVTLLDCFM